MPIAHLPEWWILQVVGVVGSCGLLIVIVALCTGSKKGKNSSSRNGIDASSHAEGVSNPTSLVCDDVAVAVNFEQTRHCSSSPASVGKSSTNGAHSSDAFPPARRTVSLNAATTEEVTVQEVPRSQTLPGKPEDTYTAVKSLGQPVPEGSGNTTSGSSEGPYARVKNVAPKEEVAYLVIDLGESEDNYEIVDGHIRRKHAGSDVSSVGAASRAEVFTYENVASDMQSQELVSEAQDSSVTSQERARKSSSKSDSDGKLPCVGLETQAGCSQYASVSRSPPAVFEAAAYAKEDSGASGYYAAVADRPQNAVQGGAAVSRVYEAVVENTKSVGSPDQGYRDEKQVRENKSEKSPKHSISSLFKKSAKPKAEGHRSRTPDGDVERKTSKKRREKSNSTSSEKDDEYVSLKRTSSLCSEAPPPPSVESLKQAVEHRRATRTSSHEQLNGLSSAESSPRSPRASSTSPALAPSNTIVTVEASRIPNQKRSSSEKDTTRSPASDDAVAPQHGIPYAKRCSHDNIPLPPPPPAPQVFDGVEIYEAITDGEKPYATVDAQLKKSIQDGNVKADGAPVRIPVGPPVKSERSLSQPSIGSPRVKVLAFATAIVDEGGIGPQVGAVVVSPSEVHALPDYATVDLVKKEEERRKKESYAAIVPKKNRGGTVGMQLNQIGSEVQAYYDGSYTLVGDKGASGIQNLETYSLPGNHTDRSQSYNGACVKEGNPARWRVVEHVVDTSAYELVPGESVIEMQRKLASSWRRHSSDELDYEEIVK